MKMFKYIRLALLKVLITLIGAVNSCLFSAGWILQAPSVLGCYLLAKKRDDSIREEVLKNRLQEPVVGMDLWSNALAEWWTDWEV